MIKLFVFQFDIFDPSLKSIICIKESSHVYDCISRVVINTEVNLSRTSVRCKSLKYHFSNLYLNLSSYNHFQAEEAAFFCRHSFQKFQQFSVSDHVNQIPHYERIPDFVHLLQGDPVLLATWIKSNRIPRNVGTHLPISHSFTDKSHRQIMQNLRKIRSRRGGCTVAFLMNTSSFERIILIHQMLRTVIVSIRS